MEGKDKQRIRRFEQVVVPHLDAAYNLARWILGNQSDADDVMQEASLRALKFIDSFQGGDSRAWMLTIARNTSYSWLRKNRMADLSDEFNEAVHTDVTIVDTESRLVSLLDSERVGKAIAMLPVRYREVLVLREIHGLSYKEISAVTGVPIGTVMSSLARARQALSDQRA